MPSPYKTMRIVSTRVVAKSSVRTTPPEPTLPRPRPFPRMRPGAACRARPRQRAALLRRLCRCDGNDQCARVITPEGDGRCMLPLWDGFLMVATVPGFFEVKRTRIEGPRFGTGG